MLNTKTKDIVDMLGKLLIPIVVVILGLIYSSMQKHHDDLQSALQRKQDSDRADFATMTLLLQQLGSDKWRERGEALIVLRAYVQRCEFTEILVPAVVDEMEDDEPKVAQKASDLFGFAAVSCKPYVDLIKKAKTNSLTMKSALARAANDNPAIAVPSQNLNPDVLMMKSAKNWYCFNMAELLWASKIRRILVQ